VQLSPHRLPRQRRRDQQQGTFFLNLGKDGQVNHRQVLEIRKNFIFY
jgi:hypothetical protein